MNNKSLNKGKIENIKIFNIYRVIVNKISKIWKNRGNAPLSTKKLKISDSFNFW